jgi:hypothetical protein
LSSEESNVPQLETGEMVTEADFQESDEVYLPKCLLILKCSHGIGHLNFELRKIAQLKNYTR